MGSKSSSNIPPNWAPPTSNYDSSTFRPLDPSNHRYDDFQYISRASGTATINRIGTIERNVSLGSGGTSTLNRARTEAEKRTSAPEPATKIADVNLTEPFQKVKLEYLTSMGTSNLNQNYATSPTGTIPKYNKGIAPPVPNTISNNPIVKENDPTPKPLNQLSPEDQQINNPEKKNYKPHGGVENRFKKDGNQNFPNKYRGPRPNASGISKPNHVKGYSGAKNQHNNQKPWKRNNLNHIKNSNFPHFPSDNKEPPNQTSSIDKKLEGISISENTDDKKDVKDAGLDKNSSTGLDTKDRSQNQHQKYVKNYQNFNKNPNSQNNGPKSDRQNNQFKQSNKARTYQNRNQNRTNDQSDTESQKSGYSNQSRNNKNHNNNFSKANNRNPQNRDQDQSDTESQKSGYSSHSFNNNQHNNNFSRPNTRNFPFGPPPRMPNWQNNPPFSNNNNFQQSSGYGPNLGQFNCPPFPWNYPPNGPGQNQFINPGLNQNVGFMNQNQFGIPGPNQQMGATNQHQFGNPGQMGYMNQSNFGNGSNMSWNSQNQYRNFGTNQPSAANENASERSSICSTNSEAGPSKNNGNPGSGPRRGNCNNGPRGRRDNQFRNNRNDQFKKFGNQNCNNSSLDDKPREGEQSNEPAKNDDTDSKNTENNQSVRKENRQQRGNSENQNNNVESNQAKEPNSTIDSKDGQCARQEDSSKDDKKTSMVTGNMSTRGSWNGASRGKFNNKTRNNYSNNGQGSNRPQYVPPFMRDKENSTKPGNNKNSENPDQEHENSKQDRKEFERKDFGPGNRSNRGSWNRPPNNFHNDRNEHNKPFMGAGNNPPRGSWGGHQRGRGRGSWNGPPNRAEQGYSNNFANPGYGPRRGQWTGPPGQNQFSNSKFQMSQIPNDLLQSMWATFMTQFGAQFMKLHMNNEKGDNNDQTPEKNKKKKRAKRQQSKTENKSEDQAEEKVEPVEPDEPETPVLEQLLALEETDDLISPKENFDCPICLMDYEPGDGVILRNCLHVFCRDCLSQTVAVSSEMEIECPQTSCEEVLQQREIRALLSGPLFENFLAISFNKIEQQTQGSVHCKEPNCPGWFVVEGCLDEFKCCVCDKINCIKCETIHAPLTCAQYQDQRRINQDDKLTDEQIKKMIDDGLAMRCPKCQILVEKIEGCDLVTCSSCKTLICWATKGPRWGPLGQGDISAGCRCNVNGIKCSPNCKYCH